MNIQQLRAQIAALQDATMDENKNFRSDYDEGRFDALSVVDALLDSLQDEPVSEDLEEVVKKLWNEINSGHEYSVIESYNVFYGLCLDIANWKKEQIMATAIDGVVTFDYYDSGDKTYGCIANSFCLEDFGLKDKDKVKVILLRRAEL